MFNFFLLAESGTISLLESREGSFNCRPKFAGLEMFSLNTENSLIVMIMVHNILPCHM